MFLSCFLLYFVKESPLFYLSRRKFKEFKKLIKEIAKINKREKELSKDFENFNEKIRSRSVDR